MERPSAILMELDEKQMKEARNVSGPAFWIHATVEMSAVDILHIVAHMECILQSLWGESVRSVAVVGTVEDEHGEHLLYGFLGMEQDQLDKMVSSGEYLERTTIDPTRYQGRMN